MAFGEAPQRLQEAFYKGYTGLISMYKSVLARVVIGEDLPPSSYRRAKRVIEQLSSKVLIAPIIGAPLALYSRTAAIIILMTPILIIPASFIAASLWRSIRATTLGL